MTANRFSTALTHPMTGLTGLCLAVGLLLSSCQDSTAEVAVISDSGESSAPPSEVASQPSAPMQGTDWRLTAWTHNGQPVPLVPDVEVSLKLEASLISGSGGCNRYSAAYRVEGDRVVAIGPLRSTRRACSGPVMEQETQFFAALQAAHRVTMRDDESLAIAYGETSTAGLLELSP